MGYNLINWENSPSKQTPINAENLNQMDDGIEKANKGIVFGYSATFTSDGVLKNTTSTEALGPGSFATSQTDIVTVFVADSVTKINNGAFSNCTSLKTIYIDNTVGNVDIVSGAVPSGVSIVYSNDENFINVNELLASAIKSLKSSVNTNRTDWENRATSIETQHKTDVQALTDKANSIVEQANTDRQNFNKSVDEINTTLDTKENVSNKVSEITHPSLDYYPDTKAVFDYVNSKLETPLSDIESLKADKLDKADFNSYKTSNDNAVNSKVDITDFNSYKTATALSVAENTNSIKALDSSKSNLVQSRNLFDIEEYLKLLSTQQDPIKDGSLDSFDNDTFTITSTKNDCYTNRWSLAEKSIYKIEVETDTDYVLSWDCNGATGNVFVFYNAQATVGNMVQVTNAKKQIAFRTNSDTEYITVRFGVAFANNTTTYCRIQLEKGNSKSSYTPHQVAVGVQELDDRVTKVKQEGTNANDNLAKSMLNLAIKNTTNVSRSTVITDSSDNNIIDLAASVEEYHMCIYGKNLIDFKNFASTGHKNTYVIADTYKIDESNAKIEYDISVGNYCGLYYRCKEFVNNSLLIDKDVTLSCVVETNKKCKFRLVDESTNKYVVKDIEADEPTRFSLGIKLNASDKAIAFYAVNVKETTHIVISDIMFELNSVCTEYEEYKNVQEVSGGTDLSTIRTNYPTTTVLCDCDCQITYVTDTKNYIDNKILEVATALVASANESEVN